MDIDAGRIATGEATIEEVGWELFRLILDVASGRKQTWSDRWGLHNALALFNPGAGDLTPRGSCAWTMHELTSWLPSPQRWSPAPAEPSGACPRT